MYFRTSTLNCGVLIAKLMAITALKRVVYSIRVRRRRHPSGSTHSIVLFGILGDSNPQPQGFIPSTQTNWASDALC